MNLQVYFYQSEEPANTPVDFSNPLHRELYNLIIKRQIPSKEATILMNKLNLPNPFKTKNTETWVSDITVVERDTSTGLAAGRGWFGHFSKYSNEEDWAID